MAFYRDRDIKKMATDFGSDGLGVAGGFIAGGSIGRTVENMVVKTPVNDLSSLGNKLLAWGANNSPKALLYILAKHYDAKSEIGDSAAKALAGSIVYDSLIRLTNKGWNPANVGLGGYRILGQGTVPGDVNVQKLLQENSLLRTELNKALQKLAGSPVRALPGNPDAPGTGFGTGTQVMDPYQRQRQFGSMIPIPSGSIDSLPQAPGVAERQRKYGAMPDTTGRPGETARQRKYGAMDAMGFKTEPHEMKAAASFGLL